MKSSASTCSLPFSDESISDLGSPVIAATNPEPKTDGPLECKGLNLFEPGDGDIQITVNGTSFESHKYLIKRFQGLKSLLDTQTLDINIQCDDISTEDFCEMFKVLYASIVAGPFVFTPHRLISTLRVATTYKHPELRDYCIQYLETLELDAVKRIELAQELHIPDWEKPAYHELGMRDEPITREEAKIIGLEAFVTIAEMREKEQRRRGKEIDAVGGEQVRRSPASASQVSAQCAIIGDEPQKASAAPLSGDTSEKNDTVAYPDHGVKVGLSQADIELGSVHASSQHVYDVEMPICKCRFTHNGIPRDRKCSLPPCVILTLEDIQAQQLAQANRISNLESSAKIFEASFATETAPTAPEVQCIPMELAPEVAPEIAPEMTPEVAPEMAPVEGWTRTDQPPAPIQNPRPLTTQEIWARALLQKYSRPTRTV